MNPHLRLGLIFSAITFNTAHAGLWSFLYSPTPDVIANTDMLDPGAPAPAPGKPVYYLAVSKGYRQFGYETSGEKIPESTGVLKIITKILDTQGYTLASAEHAPDLVILYSWGDFYKNPDPHVRNNYATEMLEFLGANKLGRRTDSRNNAFPELGTGLASLDPDSSTVAGFIPHGLYVITFWAFDFGQAQKGVSRLFWKTNISSSTRGFYLTEVLPTMLAVAAPLIGKETNRPVRIDVGEHYHPRVDLGTLQVIDVDVKLKEPK